MQHAFDKIQSGQTVCFRAGIYPMTVSSGYNQILTASGTSSSPLSFTNYPGEVAIIHGNTRIQAAYAMFLGTPNAAPGLVFEGPTGQRLGLIDVMYAHDVKFDHVEIRLADYHAAIYQYGGRNIQLTGSYIHDNGRPGYINTDQGIYWDVTSGGGNLIANNLIEHNVSTGIQLYPSPSQVTVEENTVVNNGNYGIVVYGSQNAIVNNIFADNGGAATNKQMKIYAGTDHVIDSNVFWSTVTARRGYVNGTGQKVTRPIIADPLFVNPDTHDYHLQARSPAIRAGNSGYVETADRDGAPRRSPPDLGAHEYIP